ncbi:hypothetical protein [Aquiflexum sp.]|uniref:hypothetical protein n=1 Tax=Aquiflexum sp. TaxID=1872584 RepID=UPI0035940583
MLTINNIATGVYPIMAFGKKKDDTVDKGTNRETPGNSEGARPPKKEEYKDSQGKKKIEESEDDYSPEERNTPGDH